jgi:hypothetical protein
MENAGAILAVVMDRARGVDRRWRAAVENILLADCFEV